MKHSNRSILCLPWVLALGTYAHGTEKKRYSTIVFFPLSISRCIWAGSSGTKGNKLIIYWYSGIIVIFTPAGLRLDKIMSIKTSMISKYGIMHPTNFFFLTTWKDWNNKYFGWWKYICIYIKGGNKNKQKGNTKS